VRAVIRPQSVARRGFTLVELLVSMTLLGVILAALLGGLRGQQRVYRDLAERAEARRQVRHAAALLQPELRAISIHSLAPEGSDLLVLTDSAVELRAAIGSSVVCAHDGAGALDLPPLELASGATLTAWSTLPGADDVVLVYDDGASAGMRDDRWHAFAVASVRENVAYCAGTPLTGVGDAGRVRYRVMLAAGAAIPSTVRRGAPVRFARRTRWSLYRSSDSRWYLGQREWSGRWSTTQPASGPYRAFSAAPTVTGLLFRALDSSGAAAPPTGPVAAIEVTVRATAPRLPGAAPAHGGSGIVSAGVVAAPAVWRRP
jgi:prepilin-type N-terminal cleavage/methylation domain-containing protein